MAWWCWIYFTIFRRRSTFSTAKKNENHHVFIGFYFQEIVKFGEKKNWTRTATQNDKASLLFLCWRLNKGSSSFGIFYSLSKSDGTQCTMRLAVANARSLFKYCLHKNIVLLKTTRCLDISPFYFFFFQWIFFFLSVTLKQTFSLFVVFIG